MLDLDVVVSKAVELYELKYSNFRFHDPNPMAICLPCGSPVQAIRLELSRKACLHIHSIGFIDGEGGRAEAELHNVQASSRYGDDLQKSWGGQVLDVDGAHAFSIHTLAEDDPWVQLDLKSPVDCAAVVIRNRSGGTARRSVGLMVRALVDGVWVSLYNDDVEFRSFVREVAESCFGQAGDAVGLYGAVEVACSIIAFRYDGIQRVLDGHGMDERQLVELKRSINDRVLRNRELEWTSHGIRRSFRFWSRQEQMDYVSLAVRVCDDLRAVSNDVCLGFGSVLAIARDGALIPHDDDLDVIVGFGKEGVGGIGAALEIVRKHLVGEGYKVQGRFFSHWHVLRGGRKIDVFVGVVEDGFVGWYPGRRRAFRREDIFPPRAVQFLGSTCPVPRDIELYLRKTYGPEWRTPDLGWKHEWDRTSYLDLV